MRFDLVKAREKGLDCLCREETEESSSDVVAYVFEGLWNCGGVCNTDEGIREDFQKMVLVLS